MALLSQISLITQKNLIFVTHSQDSLERARNMARIKINIWMAVATLFGCICMIWSGKKAHREGQSLLNMNVEWHRRVNEEARLAKERQGRLNEMPQL